MARALLVAAVAIGAGGGAAIGTQVAVAPTCASAAAAHHATVVVTHADGSSIRVCVGFDTDQLSGKAALDASGTHPEYGYDGQAVCAIDGEPASGSADCLSARSNYWAIWTAGWRKPWTYARLGITRLSLADGDAIGFRYVPQSGGGLPPDPGAVCPPPASPTIADSPTQTTRPPVAPASPTPAPGAVGSRPEPAAVGIDATAAPAAPIAGADGDQGAGLSGSRPGIATNGVGGAKSPTSPGLLAGLLAIAGLSIILARQLIGRRGR